MSYTLLLCMFVWSNSCRVRNVCTLGVEKKSVKEHQRHTLSYPLPLWRFVAPLANVNDAPQRPSSNPSPSFFRWNTWRSQGKATALFLKGPTVRIRVPNRVSLAAKQNLRNVHVRRCVCRIRRVCCCVSECVRVTGSRAMDS